MPPADTSTVVGRLREVLADIERGSEIHVFEPRASDLRALLSALEEDARDFEKMDPYSSTGAERRNAALSRLRALGVTGGRDGD